MNQKDKALTYIRSNLDEAAIIAALAVVARATSVAELSEQEAMVLSAMQRAKPGLQDASLADIQGYLKSLNDDQIPGLISNIKGVLHEIEFVRVENNDGDSVYVTMFEAPNHPDMDVVFTDAASGETWEAQLKATDSATYVQEWIDAHPDGEILVTSELADEMQLPNSGQSNEELTADVSDFVDKMLTTRADASLWDYFPMLSVVSVSIVVFELWKRYRRHEIDLQKFKLYAVMATGLKATKIAGLTIMLTVPVVGQFTGAMLVASLLVSAKRTWFDRPPLYAQPELLSSLKCYRQAETFFA